MLYQIPPVLDLEYYDKKGKKIEVGDYLKNELKEYSGFVVIHQNRLMVKNKQGIRYILLEHFDEEVITNPLFKFLYLVNSTKQSLLRFFRKLLSV